jgi:carbon storage regulator
MLVLSRRPGQSILIGKDIEIVVLGSDGVQVRVGIRAPREVTVLRRELLKQVEEENKRAVVTNLGAALGQLGAQMLGGGTENGIEATSVPPAAPTVAAPVAAPVNGPGTPPRRRRAGAA